MVCSSESHPHVFTESLFHSWVWNIPSLWHGTRLPREGHLHKWVWWLQTPGLPGKWLAGCPCFMPRCGNPRFLFVACRGGNWLRAEQRASADEATSFQARHRQRQPPILQQTGNQFTSLKNRTDKNPKIWGSDSGAAWVSHIASWQPAAYVFLFSFQISCEKISCNIFIKVTSLWEPRPEAAQPIRLLVLPKTHLSSLQPSYKWSGSKGHSCPVCCLFPSLNRYPISQHYFFCVPHLTQCHSPPDCFHGYPEAPPSDPSQEPCWQ